MLFYPLWSCVESYVLRLILRLWTSLSSSHCASFWMERTFPTFALALWWKLKMVRLVIPWRRWNKKHISVPRQCACHSATSFPLLTHSLLVRPGGVRFVILRKGPWSPLRPETCGQQRCCGSSGTPAPGTMWKWVLTPLSQPRSLSWGSPLTALLTRRGKRKSRFFLVLVCEFITTQGDGLKSKLFLISSLCHWEWFRRTCPEIGGRPPSAFSSCLFQACGARDLPHLGKPGYLESYLETLKNVNYSKDVLSSVFFYSRVTQTPLLKIVYPDIFVTGSQSLGPHTPMGECVKEDPCPFSHRNHSLPLLKRAVMSAHSCWGSRRCCGPGYWSADCPSLRSPWSTSVSSQRPDFPTPCCFALIRTQSS